MPEAEEEYRFLVNGSSKLPLPCSQGKLDERQASRIRPLSLDADEDPSALTLGALGLEQDPTFGSGELRRRQKVLDTSIDVIDWDTALDRIMEWAAHRESRAVAMCNAHSIVTASRDPEFSRVLESMDLATADGMSVAWMLRRLGHMEQQRVNGPDLMWKCCRRAEEAGRSVYLYGNTNDTLSKLMGRLKVAFPRLSIAGTCSPPFRDLSRIESQQIARDINRSGAELLFVSLGCPKQESWMLQHRGEIRAVMIGVGAAFDFHAGVRRRAPKWAQDRGLEWLYRLAAEPRRLAGRYVITNSAFVAGAARQLARARRTRESRQPDHG